MKKVSVILFLLVISLFYNSLLATSPDEPNEKEKKELRSKIARAIPTLNCEIDFAEDTVRIIFNINSNGNVKLLSAYGTNQFLVEHVEKALAQKKVKTDASFSGKNYTLRIIFRNGLLVRTI